MGGVYAYAYNPHCWNLESQHLAANALSSYVSMSAVLVSGAIVSNLPFSSLAVATAIASIHRTYLQMDGQAELVWVAGLITKMFYPQIVTYFSNNRAQHRATKLIKTSVL